MILSYKQQFPWGAPTNFEKKILDGSKIHTIRDDPHNRWHKGRKIHYATGVRTPNYHCFEEGVCRGIQEIKVKWFIDEHNDDCNFVQLSIQNVLWFESMKCHFKKAVDYLLMIKLAKNDGFESIEDFFKWFDKDFTGKIIHSTDFKY